MKAVEVVKDAGGEVVMVFTMVDREEGATEFFKEQNMPFRSLYSAREFLSR
jgi:orotate phosphoribosyltransferase